jgi:hypothetical protein
MYEAGLYSDMPLLQFSHHGSSTLILTGPKLTDTSLLLHCPLDGRRRTFEQMRALILSL